jgi:hypothetical protein
LQLVLGIAKSGQRLARVARPGKLIRLLNQAVDSDIFVIGIRLRTGSRQQAKKQQGGDEKQFHPLKMPEAKPFGNRAARHPIVTRGRIDL